MFTELQLTSLSLCAGCVCVPVGARMPAWVHVRACMRACVGACTSRPSAARWGSNGSLPPCTLRVLITANSLEPASSLEGIILNPITYRLRYATEAHNLSLSDGGDFTATSPE